jgi:hypothetical protein
MALLLPDNTIYVYILRYYIYSVDVLLIITTLNMLIANNVRKGRQGRDDGYYYWKSTEEQKEKRKRRDVAVYQT